jgi:hypothetical protein
MDLSKKALAVVLLALSLSGCAGIASVKVFFPTLFGMDEITDNLYVDNAMSAGDRAQVRLVVDQARTRVAAFFGDLSTSPVVLACATETCSTAFGGSGPRAKSFGESRMLLSSRGTTLPIISHEWTHIELHHRIGLWRMRLVPTWFDEGLAVVVSDEPTHSERQWEEIQRLHLPIPQLTELLSTNDWIMAVHSYGDDNDSKDPSNGRFVVYSTVGHEVRRWHAIAGRDGLLDMIAAIRDGDMFSDAYAKAEHKMLPLPEANK